jgi:hypothetical protein
MESRTAQIGNPKTQKTAMNIELLAKSNTCADQITAIDQHFPILHGQLSRAVVHCTRPYEG